MGNLLFRRPAKTEGVMEGMPQGISLLRHHDYSVITDQCKCAICSDLRDKKQAFEEAKDKVGDHGQDCRCSTCLDHMKARSAHIAATVRLDTFCESSFHASIDCRQCKSSSRHLGCTHSGKCHAIAHMEKAWEELVVKKRLTDGWWENSGIHLTGNDWNRFFKFGRSSQVLAFSGVY